MKAHTHRQWKPQKRTLNFKVICLNTNKEELNRCGFSCELIQLETLTVGAGKRLFATVCGQVHCLHSLVPPATNYSLKHRLKGHSFELPRYSYDLSRKSFVLRCCYEFKLLFGSLFVFFVFLSRVI